MGTIDKLNLTKDCISAAVDENDKHYGLFFLSCYGLISKFGSQYSELIKNVFTNCEFLIGDRPLRFFTGLAGYRHKVVSGEKACAFSSICAGLDEQLNFKLHEEEPKVCMTTIDTSPNEQLIIFTHEVSHILETLIRSVIKEDENNTIIIRRGLQIEVYDTNDKALNPVYHHTILDEAINVFQTSDMMKSICQLDRELLDDKVRDFYDKLELRSICSPYGYEEAVVYFSPLWENDVFRNSIDDNIIIGNIEKIEEDFDGYMGQGKFMKLSQALDNLYCGGNNGIKKIENDIFIRKIINDYNKCTKQKEIQKIKSRKFLD